MFNSQGINRKSFVRFRLCLFMLVLGSSYAYAQTQIAAVTTAAKLINQGKSITPPGDFNLQVNNPVQGDYIALKQIDVTLNEKDAQGQYVMIASNPGTVTPSNGQPTTTSNTGGYIASDFTNLNARTTYYVKVTLTYDSKVNGVEKLGLKVHHIKSVTTP